MSNLGTELAVDINFLTGQDRETIKRSSALLLLELKEHHRLSQAAIDIVVEGYRGLFSTIKGYIKAALRSKLADLGLNINDVGAMEEVINEVDDPFSGLETEYHQNSYYLNHFNLVVCVLLCGMTLLPRINYFYFYYYYVIFDMHAELDSHDAIGFTVYQVSSI